MHPAWIRSTSPHHRPKPHAPYRPGEVAYLPMRRGGVGTEGRQGRAPPSGNAGVEAAVVAVAITKYSYGYDDLGCVAKATAVTRNCSQPPLCASAPGSGAARGGGESSGDALSDEDVRNEGRWETSEAAEGNDQGDAEVLLLHMSGRCKPCAFVHTKGCASGASCKFCHLCGPEEKLMRQRERWERTRRKWRQLRQEEQRKARQRKHT